MDLEMAKPGFDPETETDYDLKIDLIDLTDEELFSLYRCFSAD